MKEFLLLNMRRKSETAITSDIQQTRSRVNTVGCAVNEPTVTGSVSFTTTDVVLEMTGLISASQLCCHNL